jgi:hypothetical protein
MLDLVKGYLAKSPWVMRALNGCQRPYAALALSAVQPNQRKGLTLGEERRVKTKYFQD